MDNTQSTSKSTLIDITPDSGTPVAAVDKISHIDQAILPDHKVVDITPITPSTQIVSQTPPTAISAPSPVVDSANLVVPTTTITGFQIDTSSPLFEDPDKVVLQK